jgi:hypothetical protein
VEEMGIKNIKLKLRQTSEDNFQGITLFSIGCVLLKKTIYQYAVAQFVEALRYKPERRGFDSRWCHWNFSVT